MKSYKVTCLKGAIMVPPRLATKGGDRYMHPGEFRIIKEEDLKIFPSNLIDSGDVKIEEVEKVQIVNLSGEEIQAMNPEDVLDQNTATIRKILRERNFDSGIVTKLLELEESRKKRPGLLKTLKSILKKRGIAF